VRVKNSEVYNHTDFQIAGVVFFGGDFYVSIREDHYPVLAEVVNCRLNLRPLFYGVSALLGVSCGILL
jgi:hypothetical protein